MVAERIHRCPIGRCFYLPATTKLKLATLTPDAGVAVDAYHGPVWALLSKYGIPAGPSAVEAIAARLPALPAKPRRRLERFVALVGKEAISVKVMKTMLVIMEAAFPGQNIAPDLIAAVAAHEDATWRKRSLHLNFLALAGEPAEAFCLVPSPDDLTELAARWPERDHIVARAIDDAIGAAFDLVGHNQPWLDRWEGSRPVGLWLWSWRTSEFVTPLNGGTMFTKYVWSIFDKQGALPSVRVSRSTGVSTPCGFALSHTGCTWTFAERAWSPQDDHAVHLCRGLDLEQPLYPSLWTQVPR